MMEKTKKHNSLNQLSFGKKKLVTVVVVLFLAVLFVIFGSSVINQSADISRLENQKAEISAKLDSQEKENTELQAVLDNEDRDEYIEQKAREKGYVKSNEIVFYDISGS